MFCGIRIIFRSTLLRLTHPIILKFFQPLIIYYFEDSILPISKLGGGVGGLGGGGVEFHYKVPQFEMIRLYLYIEDSIFNPFSLYLFDSFNTQNIQQ